MIKIGFNVKFYSYIGPVPINGMQTPPSPGMQFWNVLRQNGRQFKQPPRASVQLPTPLIMYIIHTQNRTLMESLI